MITQSERDFALRQLDQSTERLGRVVEGLSLDQLSYRPEPSRWSIAENVEHLVVVERRIVGAIEKLLQEAPDMARQCVMCDAEVVWRITTVAEPLQAPERVVPTLRWSLEALLPEFETTRQHTREFTSATVGDLRHHFIPHPYFGDFDCYQWLLAAGAHCNRHSAQSELVKASRGFPA